jgi:hypothetical protein
MFQGIKNLNGHKHVSLVMSMADPASHGVGVAGAPEQADGGTMPVQPPSSEKSRAMEAAQVDDSARLEQVLQSDVRGHGEIGFDDFLQLTDGHGQIGVTTLLTRLKQSISSARVGITRAASLLRSPPNSFADHVFFTQDFAIFLRKRSALEEEHAQGLKKLARAMNESAHRTEHRQGTFGKGYDEFNRIHDRMGDHGLQFALSLHQMSDDLNELASNMERGRKHWKQAGLIGEKRVQETESLAEKAKAKYDSLAEQYDRARTGDRQSGKFGLKGPRSAAQHEEDLLRKVQQADSDYASKVQAAQAQRRELKATLRPQAVRALQDLILECDSGLLLQMQKFGKLDLAIAKSG